MSEVKVTAKFNPRQLVMDVIRAVAAVVLVAAGHPYIGVLIAMIYVEMR